MSEKRIKLSPQDIILKRIEIEDLKFKLRIAEQTKELRERDLKDDIPNKSQRLKIRKDGVEIERLKHEIKIYEKMLREGEQTIEEVTPEDIKSFEEERNKSMKEE